MQVIIWYHGPKADVEAEVAKAPVFAVPGGSGKPTEQTWSEFILAATNLQNANGWSKASLGLESVKAQDAKDRSAFRATSLMFDKAMPPTATQALAKAVEARPNKAFYQARAWGAAAAQNGDGSAWPHRKAIIETQLYANGGCGLRWGLRQRLLACVASGRPPSAGRLQSQGR